MIVDTSNKTVDPQGKSLGELVDELQKLFPDTWKDFKLKAVSTTPNELRPFTKPKKYEIWWGGWYLDPNNHPTPFNPDWHERLPKYTIGDDPHLRDRFSTDCKKSVS